MSELRFQQGAASTYEQMMGVLSRRLAVRVLAAARVSPGQRVLDIAAGTGIVAAEAAALVGPSGHVTATDISPVMLEQARAKLGSRANVSFGIENAQSLGFPDESFDVVTCGLGIMFFPDPVRAIGEFHRVLRPGGYAALSANPNLARTLVLRVLVAIARHAEIGDSFRHLVNFDGGEQRLRALFETAGFRDVVTEAESETFRFASFAEYFGPTGRGAGIAGQELNALPEALRAAVIEDVRLGMNDDDGPVEVPVDVTFASGRRQ